MEAGNAYLPEFMEDYNRRCAATRRGPDVVQLPLRGLGLEWPADADDLPGRKPHRTCLLGEEEDTSTWR
jgi:hypothetical protein